LGSGKGHLFTGRHKSLIVDGSGTGYLKSVFHYVHLNPVRAKPLNEQQPLKSYVWSSYDHYLKPGGERWKWLGVDRLLCEWGIPKDSLAGRQRFGQVMERIV